MTDRVIDTSRAASARPGDALGDALDAMRSAGIEPILMRDRADDIARLDELDLLVPRNAVAPAIATLRQHGWALMQGGAIAPCKRTLGLLVDGRLLAIDLHYALVQNGLVYGDADWFAAAAVGTASDARQPRPEALLYHLIMHVVLGKDSLADKHRPLMDGVLADNPDRAAILAQAERFGLRALMAGVLDDPIGVLSDLARVARLRRRAVAALIVARPANLVRLLARRCAIRLGPLIGIRKGFCIALIGPDGAGKSTFIAEFRRQMKTLGLPTREVYMGPWDRPIMPTSRLLDWLGASPDDNIPGTEASTPAKTRLAKLAKGLAKRYLYYANTPVEFWGRYLLRVLPHMLLGRIVLMDRYVYDIELGYKNRILRNGRLVRRMIAALAPRPHLCLLLSNDPETIWRRKQEDALEDITRAMAAYRAIAQRRRIPELHTGVDAETLVRQVIETHWRRFLRWRLDRPALRRRRYFEGR